MGSGLTRSRLTGAKRKQEVRKYRILKKYGAFRGNPTPVKKRRGRILSGVKYERKQDQMKKWGWNI